MPKYYVTTISIDLTKNSTDKKTFPDYATKSTDLIKDILDDLVLLSNSNPANSSYTRIPLSKSPNRASIVIVIQIEDLSSVDNWNKSLERSVIKQFEKWKAPYEILLSKKNDAANDFSGPENIGGYSISIGLGKKPKPTTQNTVKPQGGTKVVDTDAYPGTLTKIGSRGKIVEKIQAKLGVKEDGIFGPITDRAVRRFQEFNDLVPDGIVGERTWRKLFPFVAKVDTSSTIDRKKIDPSSYSGTASIGANRNQVTYTETRGKTSSQTLKKTLSSEFKKRVEKLGDKALSFGLDITKYLLPDEEVARNFLKDLNPTFSPEDLNIMIYGTTYNPNEDILGNLKNFKQQIESAAKNVQQTANNFSAQVRGQVDNLQQNLQNNLQSAADTLRTNASNMQQRIQSDVQQNISNASNLGSQLSNNSRLTEQFLQQLESVQRLGQGQKKYTYEIIQTSSGYEVDVKYRRFDEFVISVGKRSFPTDFSQVIAGQTFSGRDAIEKSLNSEAITTGLFGYLKEQTTLPILPDKSEEQKKRIDTLREEVNSKLSSLKYGATSSLSEIAQEQSDIYSNFAREKLHSLSEYSPYPLGTASPLYKNVREKKKEIAKMVNKFVAHQQETYNAMISSITQTSTAIPAIGILVSTPPFNLPAAISLGTLVIAAINELVGKIPPILDYITHLQELVLFVSKDAYRELIRIMNPIVEVLYRIMDPIAVLKKFMGKLIEALKKLFNSKNCKKQLKRVNRDIRRKEKQIKSEKDAEEKSDLQDELKDLKERKADIEKNCSKKPAFEQDLEDLNTILKDADELSQGILSQVEESYVYDVTLPDGSRLLGISEEELQSLSTQYTVLVE